MKKTFISGVLSVALLAAAMPVAVSAQPATTVTNGYQSQSAQFYNSLGGIRSANVPNTPQSIIANTPTYAQIQQIVGTQATAVSSGGSGACGSFTTSGLSGVVGCVVSVLNDIVYVLMAAAVVYVVWGAFQMIQSEEKREAGKQTVIYGIIGLFVMISIWGFVNILDRTFNLRGTPIAPPPLTAH